MRKVTLIFAAILTVVITIVCFNSCKKIRKGVVEVQSILDSLITGGETEYYAAVFNEKISNFKYHAGNGVPFEVPGRDGWTYVYWEDKTLKELGYTKRADRTGMISSNTTHEYTREEGEHYPSSKGYWANTPVNKGKNNSGGGNGGGGTGGCGCPSGENRLYIQLKDDGSSTPSKAMRIWFIAGSGITSPSATESNPYYLSPVPLSSPQPTVTNSSSTVFTLCYKKNLTTSTMIKYDVQRNTGVWMTGADWTIGTNSPPHSFTYLNNNNCLWIKGY